ncbi:MAG: isoprenylcysteine carboxyl methyltransferase, partial [ANME-2 cluster archaeon]
MVSKTVDQNVLNSANPKHWVGLIIMHLLIPLVLMICGWDLCWWQGWLYSALIVVAGIGPRMWVE